MNTLIRRPERSSVWNLVNDFDDIFDGFRRNGAQGYQNVNNALAPAMDVVEKDDSFEVIAELPGINRDQLDVTLKDGVLTINAETTYEKDDNEEGRVIRRERRFGKYVRSLRFGTDIDSDKIDANYNDGVLKVTLPKAEKVQPRRIEVKVA